MFKYMAVIVAEYVVWDRVFKNYSILRQSGTRNSDSSINKIYFNIYLIHSNVK